MQRLCYFFCAACYGCKQGNLAVNNRSTPIPPYLTIIFILLLIIVFSTSILSPVVSAAPQDDLIITGVVDGPLSGGTPKAIEFYVVNDITDLSIYGFGSANNGGGTDGQEFTFSAVSAAAGDFLYVASESSNFETFFGFAPDYTSNAASINGDDAIELFTNGAVTDIFGDINTDGTGQSWEYLDGWAYRNDGTGPDGSTFNTSSWSFSGINALDGETTNATAATPFPIGTYTSGAADTPPGISNTSPADGAVNVSPGAVITLDFDENVDLTATAVTLECPSSSPISFTGLPISNTTSATITPTVSLPDSTVCTVTAVAAQITDLDDTVDQLDGNGDGTGGDDYHFSFTTLTTQCGSAATFIHDIQGSGTTSPYAGQTHTIEGVVVGDFQEESSIRGFYVQEEDSDSDADDATSEGIFVYDNDFGVNVNAGDLVRVDGTVTEYYDLTELNSVTRVEICGGGTATAVSVTLPFTDSGQPEQYENMLVSFPQTLTVSGNYNLGRFGEVILSYGRLMNPTNVITPGLEANNLQTANDLNRIILDDGSTLQNIDPIVHPAPGLSASNTLRGGDTVTELNGVLTYGWSGSSGTDAYRIQPVGTITFTAANERPTAVPDVGGNIKVASFNVLNYFNGDGSGGGFPTSRGADTADEFTRQRDKIIAAIIEIDADVIGLMEIENDGYGTTSAIQDLVDGLNAIAGDGTYTFVDPGVSQIGTDEIAVGLIYKPASVTTVGTTAILDSSEDATFNDDKNRPVLTQSFKANGEYFTVAVNHFKSKGSDCDALSDPDTGDGQGNCNITRTTAATALVNWLATDPTGITGAGYLIIGDLNSYAMEDPITAIKNAGYTNLIDAYGVNPYSYVYAGQAGYLDHALASASLTDLVTGTAVWHSNADEPRALDYNEEYKTTGQITSLYSADAYRASDHDPVINGLNLSYKLFLPVINN
jgi:predicted extracellular nuclease